MKIGLIITTAIFITFFFGFRNDKNYEINYEVDTISMIRNPAMGWVMYEEGWSFTESKKNPYNPTVFWEEMDQVKASSFSNIIYIRVLWSFMEPEEGKYAWIYNAEYKNYIQKAKDRGLKLAFRVFFDNGVPDYVYKAGAKSTLDPPLNLKNDKQPYYDDPIFLEKLTKFIQAFAKEYDDPHSVDFVDAYGLGRWGEGHGVTLKNANAMESVINKVTNEYAKSFKNILTVMNLSKQDYPITKTAVFEKLGFLPRRDGIGSFWFDDIERGVLKNMFPRKAFIGEACYWFNSPYDTLGYDAFKQDKRFKMNNFKEALTVAVDDALKNNSNTLDLRVPKQCKFWIEEMPDQVQLFISKGGYRLHPVKITVQQNHRLFKIDHIWNNYGVGVLPNKHPNWNLKYKVSFALLSKKTNFVEYQYVDQEIDPGDWINGHPYNYRSEISIPKSIKKGSYNLCVAIVDTQNNNLPGIKLALHDKNKIDQWVGISSVEI